MNPLRLLAAALGCALVMLGCGAPALRTVVQFEPIVIGRVFTMDSAVLKEKRHVTVYLPPAYAEESRRYPVLYLLDGGAEEDFHHITGIVQVSVMNKIMRPIIVIGIENTERRRDLTGPTENLEDKKSAPRVGGSAMFRAFLKDELIPHVDHEFRSSGKRGIMGESLAGLFVVETFLTEPDLFDDYIAVSPSLWWNDDFLLRFAEERLRGMPTRGKSLYVAVGGIEDNTKETAQFAELLQQHASDGLTWYYEPLPAEAHNTVFPIGARNGLRKLFPVESLIRR